MSEKLESSLSRSAAPRGLGEPLLQRRAAHQLLRVVVAAVGVLAQLVDGDDVGMLELAGDARLAHEPRAAACDPLPEPV